MEKGAKMVKGGAGQEVAALVPDRGTHPRSMPFHAYSTMQHAIPCVQHHAACHSMHTAPCSMPCHAYSAMQHAVGLQAACELH
eukprot:366311-Chlamydomonas_euryale.AAC.17